jgi:hypothetical protein
MGGIEIIYRQAAALVDRIQVIKITGIFLLVSGWSIVLAALALLPQGPQLNGFVPAGIVVEGIGLVLLFRSHIIKPGDHR